MTISTTVILLKQKVEYIETLSYNAKEAKEDAYSYINRFHNVSHPTLMEVYRE